MNKYVNMQCKRVVVKRCLGSAALTLSLLSLGMTVPQSVRAADNTASTSEVVPEQRQYHVRVINEKGEVMIEEDLLGTPGKYNDFSRQLLDRIEDYTETPKKGDPVVFWLAPKKGKLVDIRVYPRIDHHQTCRDVKFQFKCHFDDQPKIEKPITLSYYTEILYNHVTHKETLSFVKITNLYQTLVTGDHLILPKFEGYKLSPKSAIEVKTTGILIRPEDFDNSSTPKVVGPFDLYFINQNSTAGSGTTADQSKPGDSHQDAGSPTGKGETGTDTGTQTDHSTTDGGSQTDDQVSDAGSQTDSPAANDEQTQTDKSDSQDESTQTDHHESRDDSTQTDHHETKDDASQTDTGQDQGAQTDDTGTGEDETQTDDVSTKNDSTQTDQKSKKDDGSQTEHENNDEGTQTDQPSQKDEGTETDISKNDDSTQTEGSTSQDSASQTESRPTKEEGVQTDTKEKQDNESQTDKIGTSDDSNQTKATVSKDDAVQTDKHNDHVDTGIQTGDQGSGTDSSVQTDGDAVADEGTQTSSVEVSDQASQTDVSKQEDATAQTDSTNNMADAGTQTTPESTSDDSSQTDLSSDKQIDVKDKENIEQHVDRPSQDEHSQVNSADRSDSRSNNVAATLMPTSANQDSVESPMLDSASQPSAKDNAGASDLEKINELNQLPLNSSADKNAELPQTSGRGHGFLASLLGMIMAVLSICGLARRRD